MADKIVLETSKRIKKLRINQKLSQVILSEKAGINSNYYAKIERGEIKPSIEIYEKIAKALGVKSNDLFPF